MEISDEIEVAGRCPKCKGKLKLGPTVSDFQCTDCGSLFKGEIRLINVVCEEKVDD